MEHGHYELIIVFVFREIFYAASISSHSLNLTVDESWKFRHRVLF